MYRDSMGNLYDSAYLEAWAKRFYKGIDPSGEFVILPNDWLERAVKVLKLEIIGE